MPNAAASHRFAYLDGLRAMAIGAVLGLHWVAHYTPVGRGGLIGVDLFFVLSGYIITTILWRAEPTGALTAQVGDFLRRRVRRLYPALLGLVVAAVVLGMLIPIDGFTRTDFLRSAVLSAVQLNWVPLALNGESIVLGHTWSLGVEWIFYLLWPWLLLGLRRRGSTARTAAWTAAGTGVALYALSFAVSATWFTYGPVGRTAVMLAGSALALAMIAAPPTQLADRARTLLADAAAVVAVLAFTGYVLVGFTTLEPGVRYLGVPLATLVGCYLIWYGYVRTTGPVIALFTLAPLTLLGRVSYSLYLWHIVPLGFLDKDRIPLPSPVLGVIGVLLTALATWLSYRFLEKPFLRARTGVLAPGAVRSARVPADR